MWGLCDEAPSGHPSPAALSQDRFHFWFLFLPGCWDLGAAHTADIYRQGASLCCVCARDLQRKKPEGSPAAAGLGAITCVWVGRQGWWVAGEAEIFGVVARLQKPKSQLGLRALLQAEELCFKRYLWCQLCPCTDLRALSHCVCAPNCTERTNTCVCVYVFIYKYIYIYI